VVCEAKWGVRVRFSGLGAERPGPSVGSVSGGTCEGVEHALPDLVRWGIDAGGRQHVLHMRAKECIDLGESSFDFSYLDVEVSHGDGATFLEFAPRDGPVGSKPPKHDPAFEELAHGAEVFRWKAPVDGYRAIEFVQGLNKGCRRCTGAERGIPRGGQAVSVKHPRLFHVEVQKAFLLFEPPAEGGFPRSWDAGDKEMHAVSLASLGQARNAAGRGLYIRYGSGIRKR